jgi:hypothetical protein
MTYLVPLKPGELFPHLPPQGIVSSSELNAIPGAKPSPDYLQPGEHAGTYVYSKALVHRNLYRIPLP